MKNIIHITHTDIKNDWRIRKEMIALDTNKDFNVKGIGLDFFINLDFPNDDLKSFNITRRIYNNKLLNSIFTFYSLIKMFFCLFNFKIDVLHCHDTPALLIGYLYKVFRKNTTLIYDAHELESDKGGQLILFKYITLLIEFICCKKVDGFITVSDSILNFYKNKFGFKNVELIYNIPNYTESINVPKIREIYQLSDSIELFTHVGLLNVGRGVDDIIEVFKKESMSNKYIIFFGFGDLVEKIQNLPNKNIIYYGNVENKYLHSFIQQFDFGICTIENHSLSDYFSLPNKLFEYINANVTTISSDFPDIQLLTDDLSCGYCVNNIEYILKNNLKKKEFSCKEEYTWGFQENKLKMFYENLL